MDVNHRGSSQGQVETQGSVPVELQIHRDSHPQEEKCLPIPLSIVSNSHLLCEGLIGLLSPHLHLKLIASYSGAFPFESPLLNPLGHFVLLDSGIGWEAALGWIQHWRGQTPPAFVLILELPNEIDLILASIEAGVSGYTLQGASAMEVAKAIMDAHSGIAHCSPEVTARLYARMTFLRGTVMKLSVSPLTARESEILRYIAAGYTNLEIATQLVLGLRTVKQHVHHILGKLNSRTRAEAVRYAGEQGWLNRAPAVPMKRA